MVELRTRVSCLDLVPVVSRLHSCSCLWYGCIVAAGDDGGEDVLLVVVGVPGEAGLLLRRVWGRGGVCQWHSKASCGKRGLGGKD